MLAYGIIQTLLSPSVLDIVVFAVMLCTFHVQRLYRSWLSLSVLDDFHSLSGGVVVATALAVLLDVWRHPSDASLSRGVVEGVVVLAGILLVRSLAYETIRLARRAGHVRHPALILGAGHVGIKLAAALQEHRELGLDPVGFIDSNPRIEQSANLPAPLLGGYDDLARMIRQFAAEVVVVAFGALRESDLIDVLRTCDRRQYEIMFVLRLFEVHNITRDMDQVWGIPLVRVRRAPFRSFFWRVKRAVDAVLAAIAIDVRFPVGVACALVVRLESGPGFLFRQERVGLDGRPFVLLMLRSLKSATDTESSVTWNISDDLRLWQVGRLRRRASLDELPQLWNLLRGDMSLVGPRPERGQLPAEVLLQHPALHGAPPRARRTHRLGSSARPTWRYLHRRPRQPRQLLHRELVALGRRQDYGSDGGPAAPARRQLATAGSVAPTAPRRGKITMSGPPQVALVHPWLTNQGGSERVLEAFCRAYPRAPIYTSVYDPPALPMFADRDVRTSFLHGWPLSRRRHQLFPLLRRQAFESFDLSEFDLVLTSDHAEAKGVLTGPETLHIAYLHTPTRYYWSDSSAYLREPGFGRLDPVVRAVMPTLASSMRQWDYLAAQRPDYLLANSHVVSRRISKHYRRPSDVLHAPVDVSRFTGMQQRGDHLLVVSRLIPYKRVDLAVRACRELDIPLRVVGSGPERAALQAAAGPGTTFLGALDDRGVARELASAAGFLFPANEDFGLTPLEAMASGTPVLAYGGGGALETVVNGLTGTFFAEQTVGSLVAALREFCPHTYNAEVLRSHAASISVEAFVDGLRACVDERWAEMRSAQVQRPALIVPERLR